MERYDGLQENIESQNIRTRKIYAKNYIHLDCPVKGSTIYALPSGV